LFDSSVPRLAALLFWLSFVELGERVVGQLTEFFRREIVEGAHDLR
jgi:hypothetical protein